MRRIRHKRARDVHDLRQTGVSRRRDYRAVPAGSLFFLEAKIGELYPPAITHPEFYYAFAAVALVWQLGYFVISTDPVRYRAFMPVALLAKLTVVLTAAAMLALGRISFDAGVAGFPDAIFVVLFFIAWMKTPRG